MKARDGTAADQADLIVRNAKITTLQSDGSVAEALAVRGEKFVAHGGSGRDGRGCGVQVVASMAARWGWRRAVGR
jgi:predicted amidohydrolase YtcJ